MLPGTMELDQRGQVVVARPGMAEVSATQMQELGAELEERMRFDNAQHFVLDMEGVQYIASSCLGVMVQFLQDIEHMRGRILLASCSENVLFLFKVTRLDAVFLIFEDVDEAMAELV